MFGKDNALFASIRSAITTQKTKRAEIVYELVNLDHVLGEMISYNEVFRVRSRQETTTGDN